MASDFGIGRFWVRFRSPVAWVLMHESAHPSLQEVSSLQSRGVSRISDLPDWRQKGRGNPGSQPYATRPGPVQVHLPNRQLGRSTWEEASSQLGPRRCVVELSLSLSVACRAPEGQGQSAGLRVIPAISSQATRPGPLLCKESSRRSPQ